jgi:transcriptional regulator CtsR
MNRTSIESLMMANGGEIDMAIEDVSRGTMDMQPTQEEVTMVQQIMQSVMQMVSQGASEEEIVMALQQMGLDQEDIAMVMQVVAQQMQAPEAPVPAQGQAIDAELSQMM